MTLRDLPIEEIIADACVSASGGSPQGLEAVQWWLSVADLDASYRSARAAIQMAVGYAAGQFTKQQMEGWKPWIL